MQQERFFYQDSVECEKINILRENRMSNWQTVVPVHPSRLRRRDAAFVRMKVYLHVVAGHIEARSPLHMNQMCKSPEKNLQICNNINTVLL